SSRSRHTSFSRDWSSDVCSSDLEHLRREALAAARSAPLFLRLLAEQSAQLHPAIGLFGRLREQGGRIDLKLGGLLPLVSAARVKIGRASRRERGGVGAAAGAYTH